MKSLMVMFLLLLTCGCAHKSAVYREDFNDGIAQGWHDPWGFFYGIEKTDERGHGPYLFSEENHWISGEPDLYCWYKERTFKNFVWTLELRDGYNGNTHFWNGVRYGSGGAGGLSLIFCAATPAETPSVYYELYLGGVERGLTLWKKNVAENKNLGKTSFSFTRDPDWPRWHKLRLKVVDAEISVYLDDLETPCLQARDESLSGGYLGFCAQHFPNYWLIDNIIIESLP